MTINGVIMYAGSRRYSKLFQGWGGSLGEMQMHAESGAVLREGDEENTFFFFLYFCECGRNERLMGLMYDGCGREWQALWLINS